MLIFGKMFRPPDTHFGFDRILANNVELTVVKAGPAPQNIEQLLTKSIKAEFLSSKK